MYIAECEFFTVEFNFFVLLCADCTVQSIKKNISVQCPVHSVKSMLYSVQCIVYSVLCIVYSVKCTVYSV